MKVLVGWEQEIVGNAQRRQHPERGDAYVVEVKRGAEDGFVPSLQNGSDRRRLLSGSTWRYNRSSDL